MGKKRLKISVAVALLLCFGGCAASGPKATGDLFEEEKIRKMLLHSQEAWNNQDEEAILSDYAKDAQIMFGRERDFATKDEFASMLPFMYAAIGDVKIESPSIIVKRDRAVINVWMYFSNIDLVCFDKTLELVKEPVSGRWLIESSTYTIYFRGGIDPRERRKGPYPGEELDP